MPEETSDEGKSQITEVGGTIAEAIKRIGIARIILAIIIIGIAWWFYSLPKPGELYISVKELDSTSAIEGVTVSLTWQDGQLLGDNFAYTTDSTGVVSFQNVPTERELIIETDASSTGLNYEVNRQRVTLKSGEAKQVEVQLAKSTNLAFSPNKLTGSVSEKCVRETTITVTNNGGDPTDVQFTGTGALADAVSSNAINVFPGSSENATVFIDVSKTGKRKGDDLNGGLRARGTSRSVIVELDVSEPPRVTLEPESLRCPAGRESCQFIVSVKNTGGTTLYNLKAEPTPDIEQFVAIQPYYSTNAVAPGEEAKFGVTITPSSPAIGVITVKADCFSKQIDVQT